MIDKKKNELNIKDILQENNFACENMQENNHSVKCQKNKDNIDCNCHLPQEKENLKDIVDEQIDDCEEETMQHFDVVEDGGKRLDVFLTEQLADISRSLIKNLIDQNKVYVNGKNVKAGYKLNIGDKVEITIPEPEVADILPENIPLDIVYEDDDIIVVNKPQGMVVHPAGKLKTGTLVNALMFHTKNLSGINGKIRPGIVHRIDKDTSGLLVVAKNDFCHSNLQKQIQDKTCHRIYKAVCYGIFQNKNGVITTDLARGKEHHEMIYVVPRGQGRYAETHYTVIDENRGFSLVKFELKTGRTHQIRVHAKHIGHPVVGDKLYGRKDEKFGLAGQLLHAEILILTHPKTGERMEFYAPLPDYFKEFLVEKGLKNEEN